MAMDESPGALLTSAFGCSWSSHVIQNTASPASPASLHVKHGFDPSSYFIPMGSTKKHGMMTNLSQENLIVGLNQQVFSHLFRPRWSSNKPTNPKHETKQWGWMISLPDEAVVGRH